MQLFVFIFLFYNQILLQFSIFAYVLDHNVLGRVTNWTAKPPESDSQKRSTYIKYWKVKKSLDKINIPWWPWLKEHKGCDLQSACDSSHLEESRNPSYYFYLICDPKYNSNPLICSISKVFRPIPPTCKPTNSPSYAIFYTCMRHQKGSLVIMRQRRMDCISNLLWWRSKRWTKVKKGRFHFITKYTLANSVPSCSPSCQICSFFIGSRFIAFYLIPCASICQKAFESFKQFGHKARKVIYTIGITNSKAGYRRKNLRESRLLQHQGNYM